MRFNSIVTAIAASLSTIFVATEALATCPGPGCPTGRNGISSAIIGGVVKVFPKTKKTQRKKAPTPADTSNRMRARELQTALNFFGFEAGVADGIIGRRTRNAIAEYQAFRGLPATGVLSTKEQYDLLSSLRFAQGQAERQVADLSIEDRRESLNQTIASMEARQLQASAVAALPSRPKNPNSTPGLSTANHCAALELLELERGPSASNRQVPLSEILDRRICSSRISTLKRGQALIATITGVEDHEIEQQCFQLIPFVNSSVSTNWTSMSADAVINVLKANISKSVQEPEGLKATAMVCASIGYKVDSTALVLSSALVGGAIGDGDMLETVALLRAMETEKWIESDAILSWFAAAYASKEETGPTNLDSDALRAAIEEKTGR